MNPSHGYDHVHAFIRAVLSGEIQIVAADHGSIVDQIFCEDPELRFLMRALLQQAQRLVDAVHRYGGRSGSASGSAETNITSPNPAMHGDADTDIPASRTQTAATEQQSGDLIRSRTTGSTCDSGNGNNTVAEAEGHSQRSTARGSFQHQRIASALEGRVTGPQPSKAPQTGNRQRKLEPRRPKAAQKRWASRPDPYHTIRANTADCHADDAPESRQKVQRLVAALWDQQAVEQFCNLVLSRRAVRLEASGDSAEPDFSARLEEQIHHISAARDKTVFATCLTRLSQYRLASIVDEEKRRYVRLRNDPVVIRAVLDRTGWTKSKLHRHCSHGRKWQRVCGAQEGLLCFIPVGAELDTKVSGGDYTGLSDNEIKEFHNLLDGEYIRTLCLAGQRFWDTLDRTSDDVEFRWESIHQSVSAMAEHELNWNIQPVPSHCDNIWQQETACERERPVQWPQAWPWPVNPTAIIHEDVHTCDFCPERSCECGTRSLADSSTPKPRIKLYGSARGIQAISERPGEVAYRQDEVIGKITGRLERDEPANGSIWFPLVRPDLPGHAPVCYVVCDDTGNCLRLVRHTCTPPATYRVVKISGKYGLVIVALRDIYDGEEITVPCAIRKAAESPEPCQRCT